MYALNRSFDFVDNKKYVPYIYYIPVIQILENVYGSYTRLVLI